VQSVAATGTRTTRSAALVGSTFIFTQSAPHAGDGAAALERIVETLGADAAAPAELLCGLLVERITVEDLRVGSAAASP
jgi:hypothetical protein